MSLKNIYNVSLCKNGLLGGFLSIEESELLYRTTKLTVPENIRKLHMPFSDIQEISRASFHTIHISMKDDKTYRFLIFSRERFLKNVEGML